MDRSYRAWFTLALVLALFPAGVRLLLWQKAYSTPVDPAMARAGEVLFNHQFTPKDKLCGGDGLGPVFNANSCKACHHQGGVGGAGDERFNVTTFSVSSGGMKREGVVHSGAVRQRETLADVNSTLPTISQPSLQQVVMLAGRENHCLSFPSGVSVSQRNTPAIFGAKLIDEIPDRVILANARAQRLKWGMAPADEEGTPVGRVARLPNGKIGKFGWKGQMASLTDFVQAACANELGLSNPGQPQPAPLFAPTMPQPKGYDLTLEQCDQLTAFCASLNRPVERLDKGITEDQAAHGKKLFGKIGCAECHTPKLGGVDGLYSDLLLHKMGQDLVGGGSYGEPPIPIPEFSDEAPSASEWRTPPLWGVADSGPYLHDGRAKTLEEAIRMHGGQGQRSSSNFMALSGSEQLAVIAFLKTLRAP